MKSAIAFFVFLTSIQGFAAQLLAVDCKREMEATALSYIINQSTFEALESSTFEITDFQYSHDKGWKYTVSTDTKSRRDGSVTTKNVNVRVKNLKKCKIEAMLIAG